MTNGSRIENGTLYIDGNCPVICSGLFSGSNDFTRVVLSEGIVSFESEAFADCTALEEAVLPEGISEIGVAAFASCTSLKSINIPYSVKKIDDGAFLECESLNQIYLPEGLETISDLAFQCSGLETIDIPSSVSYIGEEAFYDCSNLRKLNIFGTGTRFYASSFGSNYNLIEGYVAPGFPEEFAQSSEFLFSILWATSYGRHSAETLTRAEKFIRSNESLVIKKIFSDNNIPAMEGLVKNSLLSPEKLNSYVAASVSAGLTEITSLLLKAKNENISSRNQGEFDL